ncbi:putative iron-regulated membrane protein [Campylobacter curvus 525.92]|uniref:Iron-regulated membrane protein n=1 Tax=Campylobacter curvus (strain 525.92) TaxID=360105 RepID=A7GWL0_CAMC5|nr:putative iron-regulated membrane protein [Campylobacter curvus 525.92]
MGVRRIFKRGKFCFNAHLILALVFSLPLLVVAISGALLSYADEISEGLNRKNLTLNLARGVSDPPKISEILNRFGEKNRDFSFKILLVRNGLNLAADVYDANFDAFLIDPYTGEMIGADAGDKFEKILVNLHVNLALGLINGELATLGENVVLLATLALFLLALSGIWLYFPFFRRNARLFIGKNLYKLHGSLGIYASAVLVLVMLSGVYLSSRTASNFINGVFDLSAPKSDFVPPEAKKVAQLNLGEFDRVERIFRSEVGENFEEFSLFMQGEGKFRIFYVPLNETDKENVGEILIDARNGALLKHVRASSGGKDALWLRKTMLNLHTGRSFGEADRFIFCVASLLVVVFIVSGFLMSLKRLKGRVRIG